MEYGQLPFWNPWYCGGNVLGQNPQVALLSPVCPLSTVVSLALAMNRGSGQAANFVSLRCALRRLEEAEPRVTSTPTGWRQRADRVGLAPDPHRLTRVRSVRLPEALRKDVEPAARAKRLNLQQAM